MDYEVPIGKVQTVLGAIAPGDLGVTLTHEHLLIDLSPVAAPRPSAASGRGFYQKPVSADITGYISQHAWPNIDNSLLLDVPTAIEEARLYKQHGGNGLVDATSIGIARDPRALALIARATGLNIVMGASYYVAPAHPPQMDSMGEDDIVEQIVTDVTEGADGTGVKAGVIGEVGCSWPLTDNERKVVRASGRAQRLTGAPLLIHPGRDETSPLEIIDVLTEVGADLSHTIMGHLDRTVFLHSTLEQVAQSGCFLEWDLFGREISYYRHNPSIDNPGDAKRMDDIAWISAHGYGERIVVAHDICSKDRLTKYGGHGYFYFLSHVVPRMRDRGFSQEAIDKILVSNPSEVLRFRQPAA